MPQLCVKIYYNPQKMMSYVYGYGHNTPKIYSRHLNLHDHSSSNASKTWEVKKGE